MFKNNNEILSEQKNVHKKPYFHTLNKNTVKLRVQHYTTFVFIKIFFSN